eukprot:14296-Heterococcus_DN1.PRE.1
MSISSGARALWDRHVIRLVLTDQYAHAYAFSKLSYCLTLGRRTQYVYARVYSTQYLCCVDAYHHLRRQRRSRAHIVLTAAGVKPIVAVCNTDSLFKAAIHGFVQAYLKLFCYTALVVAASPYKYMTICCMLPQSILNTCCVPVKHCWFIEHHATHCRNH